MKMLELIIFSMFSAYIISLAVMHIARLLLRNDERISGLKKSLEAIELYSPSFL